MGYVWTFILSALLAFVLMTAYWGHRATKNKIDSQQQVMEGQLVINVDTINLTIYVENAGRPDLTAKVYSVKIKKDSDGKK